MPNFNEPLLLAPNFFLIVRWSARIMDAVEDLENRHAQARLKHPSGLKAISSALTSVKQEQYRAPALLATTYRLSGVLPAPGDTLWVGALELRVDQRHFTTRQVGGVEQAEVIVYLGVERYRDKSITASDTRYQQAASSLFSTE